MTLVLICALIGVFAGLLGGALGLGGGVVIVPPLIYLFHAMGFDGAVVAQMAVGTSLATIIVTPPATLSKVSHSNTDETSDVMRMTNLRKPIGWTLIF